MSNKNAYLNDDNLLTLFSLNNLIIPEMQREYVWGAKNNEEKIVKLLKDVLPNDNCEKCGHSHSYEDKNIGFLYSYKPTYARLENDRHQDEYLIDGQQRVTTMFLLLTYCAVREHRIKDFLSICRYDQDSPSMCLEYKVRDLTSHFISQLMQKISAWDYSYNKEDDFFSFLDSSSTYPTWILHDFCNDVTVKNMLNALRVIRNVMNEDGYKTNKYFDYIIFHIRFWHFKTDATSLGEELYITMNARGEQLVINETIKAQLFKNTDQLKWGSKWEEWQDFFWKHRRTNADSGTGFDSYLNCIYELERFIIKKRKINENIASGKTQVVWKTEEDWASAYEPDLKIESVESYINALRTVVCLLEDKDRLNRTGLYVEWAEDCLERILILINDGTEWFLPFETSALKNSTKKQIDLQLLWSWMHYIVKRNADHNPEDTTDADRELLRLIHFYYIRYRQGRRTATTITDVVENVLFGKDGNPGLTSENITLVKESESHSSMQLDQDSDDVRNSQAAITGKSQNEEAFLLDICTDPGLEHQLWEVQNISVLVDGNSIVAYPCISLYLKEEPVDSLSGPNSYQRQLQKILEVFTVLDEAINSSDHRQETCNLLKSNLLYLENWPWKKQYSTKYECSNWLYIIKNGFLAFYNEIDSINRNVLINRLNQKRIDLLKQLGIQLKQVKNISDTELSGIPKEIKVLLSDAFCEDFWKYGGFQYWGTEVWQYGYRIKIYDRLDDPAKWSREKVNALAYFAIKSRVKITRRRYLNK